MSEINVRLTERGIDVSSDARSTVGIRPIPSLSTKERVDFLRYSLKCELLNKNNIKNRMSSPVRSLTGLWRILSNDPETQLSTEYIIIDPSKHSDYCLINTTGEATSYINGNNVPTPSSEKELSQDILIPGENLVKSSPGSKIIFIIDAKGLYETIFDPRLYNWEIYWKNSGEWEIIHTIESESNKTKKRTQINTSEPAVEFIKNSVKLSNNGPYSGIPHAVYDADLETYRGNYWLWSTAPAIRVLTQSGEHQLARRAADAYMRFIEQRPGGSEGIGIKARLDPDSSEKTGFKTFVPPNDSAYIAQWAWLTAYNNYNEERYLNKCLDISRMIKEVFEEFGYLPVYYDLTNQRWSERTYVDACFTVTFLKELYTITENYWLKSLAIDIIDDLIAQLKGDTFFIMNSGDNNRYSKNHIFVRGQGWAIDGLLAASELADDSYLEYAMDIADALVENQNGGWGYFLSESKTIDTTTTAVVSYYIKLLNESIRGDRYESNIKTALRTCTNSIRTENCTVGGYGGLFCRSHGSGLVRKNYVDSATVLGAAYYSLLKQKNYE